MDDGEKVIRKDFDSVCILRMDLALGRRFSSRKIHGSSFFYTGLLGAQSYLLGVKRHYIPVHRPCLLHRASKTLCTSILMCQFLCLYYHYVDLFIYLLASRYRVTGKQVRREVIPWRENVLNTHVGSLLDKEKIKKRKRGLTSTSTLTQIHKSLSPDIGNIGSYRLV
jgi:hypothetical protein